VSDEVEKPETVSERGSKTMAKTTKKTTKKNGRDRGATTTVQFRQEATALLRELTDMIEADVGIKLQPSQVILIALKNEVARRKEGGGS